MGRSLLQILALAGFIAVLNLPPSLNAKDSAKPAETSAEDKDLCSYLKDIESKTDADCLQDALSALKIKDRAAYSRKVELARKRKPMVLDAYAALKARASEDADRQAKQKPSPLAPLEPPINERTFAAWVGPETKDLKDVHTQWLKAQNQELAQEMENPVSPERRKAIDVAMAGNQAKISALGRIKDPGELRCFLGEICGQRADSSDISGGDGTTGKGSWTEDDFKRANADEKRRNTTGKLSTTEVPSTIAKDSESPSGQGLPPLLPFAAPLGATLFGYGVYRSRKTWESENGNAPVEKSDSKDLPSTPQEPSAPSASPSMAFQAIPVVVPTATRGFGAAARLLGSSILPAATIILSLLSLKGDAQPPPRSSDKSAAQGEHSPAPLLAPSASPNYADPQRQREYDRAKDFCDKPPDATDDECSDLSRAIDHAEKCIELYEAWDSRWEPGRHSDKIVQRQSRVQRLKVEYQRRCAQK